MQGICNHAIHFESSTIHDIFCKDLGVINIIPKSCLGIDNPGDLGNLFNSVLSRLINASGKQTHIHMHIISLRTSKFYQALKTTF